MSTVVQHLAASTLPREANEKVKNVQTREGLLYLPDDMTTTKITIIKISFCFLEKDLLTTKQ